MATIEKDLRNSVEFIQDRLHYVALGSNPPQNPKRHFFSIDTELIYWNFFLDFGPLNFGQLYRFCEKLNRKLSDPRLRDKVIYYYSSTHSHKRANAAFLISAWAILYQGRTPEEAFQPFKNYSPPFPPWHDATPTICTYQLSILDTLRGLYKARECKFFDLDTFNIDEYEHYEQVENGDLNWCVAGKFIAFAGPHATREMSAGGYHTLCPSDYIPYFKKRNVTLVVRLNKKYYPAESFIHHGIDHIELEFLDGSNPPDYILTKFIDRCELTPGAAAVHCKAGLGRTGSCIGAYIMKHFRLTAEECIGWLRIVRPGMVIGPQQQWMKDMQHKMWQEGEVFYAKLTNAVNNLPLPAVAGITHSNRSTPRGSILAPKLNHQQHAISGGNSLPSSGSYSDLPAMEEKSSQRGVDEVDGDGKAQGDLLRLRREQQHKHHFPIEPMLTSVSMKVPNHAVNHVLRPTASAARASAMTISVGVRPNTPGSSSNVNVNNNSNSSSNSGNSSSSSSGSNSSSSIISNHSNTISSNVGKLLNNGGVDHHAASGRILRTPTNAALNASSSNSHIHGNTATGTIPSPIQTTGTTSSSSNLVHTSSNSSNSPKSSGSNSPPNSAGKTGGTSFSSFFGSWRA